MSISQNFPEEGPTLNLNFAGSKVLDPRITFARPSTSGDATYTDANGLVVTAAADEPRFDHRYVNGEIESLGLLVEEQRKNFAIYSEDFTQWTNTNTTDDVDTSIIAPDGTNTATKLTDDSTNFSHNIKENFTTDSSDTFTASCFVKKGDFSYFIMVLRILANGENAYAKFDFDNPSNNTTYGNGTNRSQTVTEYPNGWYRISVTATFGAAVTSVNPHIHLTNSDSDTSYSGSGNYNYIWGAQLEVGAFPTSYIPTSGSQATRSPDEVSMTGTNFSDWYNQSEGTIYCSGNNTGITTTTSRFYYAIENTSSPSGDFIRKWIWNGATGLLLNSFYTSNTTGQGSVISAEFNNTLTTDNKKTAVGYAKSDFASYYNGTSLNTDTSGNLPVGIDRLRIGTNLSGHISQLTYYPTRLSNTVLQNLTK